MTHGMGKPPKKTDKVTPDILIKTIWVSTFLAAIFVLPAMGIFLGIYYSTGNLLIGAVVGFGVHFVTLAFAGKISRFLTEIIGTGN